MNAPTRRRKAFSEASTQSPFEAEVRIRRLAAAFLSSGDAAFEIRDGGRHFSVGGVGDAPAVDLDGAHAAEARGQQRVALRRHFFEGHV